MMEENPIGFIDELPPDVEVSDGMAGKELLEAQWGVAEAASVEYRRSKENKTPGLNIRLVMDEKLSLTPKRSTFITIWLTPGMQPQLDGIFRAFGLGALSHKFGERKLEDGMIVNDPRSAFPDVDVAGAMLAKALTGKKAIVCVGIEVSKSDAYNDKNNLAGFHRMTEENLAALAESGFGPKSLTVKKKKPSGESYLSVKKGMAGKVNAASGAPSTIVNV